MVIRNEDDADGQARATVEEDQVVRVDWTEIKCVGWLIVITLYVSERSLYSMHLLIICV